ncbi:MAG: hypothetical protein ACE5GS_09285 [Kiloniellaceae bacterium]
MRGLAAIAIVFAVSACALPAKFGEGARPKFVDLPPAPLPSYRTGDTFVYSDGTATPLVRRVVGVNAETVDWVTEKDFRFTTYRNFALPRLKWNGPSSAGTMLNALRPAELWPLEPKKTAQVTADYNRLDKATNETSTYKENWSCKVNRARAVTVPAGTFDAFKIICRRLNQAGKTTRTHIWYYAPQVGHFVKRIKKYGNRPDRVIELVTYRPGAGA